MKSFAKYLATQIYQGRLKEEDVYKLYGEYKDDIEAYLTEWKSQEIPLVEE